MLSYDLRKETVVEKNDKHIPQMVVSLMVMNPMVESVKHHQLNTSK